MLQLTKSCQNKVFADYIAGSGQELRSRVFLKLTADKVLGFRLVLGITLREMEGVNAKAKFRRTLTPDA